MTTPATGSDQATVDTEAIVTVTDLVAGYLPGVNILNGCSIEARKGELIGIIGPNGAGKSTLLKAMFGLVKIHSGTVVVRGNDLTGLKANKLVSRGLGFVPQNDNVSISAYLKYCDQLGLSPAGRKSLEIDKGGESSGSKLGKLRGVHGGKTA